MPVPSRIERVQGVDMQGGLSQGDDAVPENAWQYHTDISGQVLEENINVRPQEVSRDPYLNSDHANNDGSFSVSPQSNFGTPIGIQMHPNAQPIQAFCGDDGSMETYQTIDSQPGNVYLRGAILGQETDVKNLDPRYSEIQDYQSIQEASFPTHNLSWGPGWNQREPKNYPETRGAVRCDKTRPSSSFVQVPLRVRGRFYARCLYPGCDRVIYSSLSMSKARDNLHQSHQKKEKNHEEWLKNKRPEQRCDVADKRASHFRPY
ncbi:hypothetical protein TWF106_006312 [Orbilia oligospora]|uniref:Uncharacterized protein n=1 Tax=Orbilia oligospora TaxID=2813651 RepID=A0A7C8QXG5_ORBOL|nr:hypothetical protein TWF106_006312 [Orbilia oligospora]